MQAVTVSPKFQVVIPREIREQMKIKPGQKMQMIENGGQITMIPFRSILEMRGFLKGMNTDFERDEDRF